MIAPAATNTLVGLGIGFALLVGCSPTEVFEPPASTTTASAITTTTTPTLAETCGSDRTSLVDLIGADEPFLNAAQDVWEHWGGVALGCYLDLLTVGSQRLVRLIAENGVINAIFARHAGTADAVAVFAPFTTPVETVVRTGAVTTVDERLVVDGQGVATLVGLADGSCRLILALDAPIGDKLAETFDDWESGFIIQRAVETGSTMMSARQIEAERYAVTLGAIGEGLADNLVLEVDDLGITVDDLGSRRPSDTAEPCPHGWWDMVVAAMGD